MEKPGTFHWHPNAALFAGPNPVPRPAHSRSEPRHIRIGSLQETLAAVGGALRDGAAFSLSQETSADRALPDATFVTYTSGSTGTPKGILRRHASWIASFKVTARVFDLPLGTHTACLGRLGPSLTLYAVAEALYLGQTCHVLAGLSAAHQCALIDKHRVKALYATPTQLRRLCLGKPKAALHSVAYIFCGGGALDEATRHTIEKHCPNARIHVFYGAAETSFITMSGADTPAGAVGTAYPNVEIEIREGMIWVRSPYLFEGYTTGAPLPTSQDGFVTAGELGTLDADGNLWLTGRANRQVQIADQSVSPEVIEQHILTLTGVTACAVLPEPDRTRGVRLVTFVCGPGQPGLKDAILGHCRIRFGTMIAPKEVRFVPDWPVLPSGKTDLRSLAQLLARSA